MDTVPQLQDFQRDKISKSSSSESKNLSSRSASEESRRNKTPPQQTPGVGCPAVGTAPRTLHLALGTAEGGTPGPARWGVGLPGCGRRQAGSFHWRGEGGEENPTGASEERTRFSEEPRGKGQGLGGQGFPSQEGGAPPVPSLQCGTLTPFWFLSDSGSVTILHDLLGGTGTRASSSSQRQMDA